MSQIIDPSSRSYLGGSEENINRIKILTWFTSLPLETAIGIKDMYESALQKYNERLDREIEEVTTEASDEDYN